MKLVPRRKSDASRVLEVSKPGFNGDCAVGFPPEPFVNVGFLVGFPFFHVDDGDEPSVADKSGPGAK
jgi:hypothetical protein